MPAIRRGDKHAFSCDAQQLAQQPNLSLMAAIGLDQRMTGHPVEFTIGIRQLAKLIALQRIAVAELQTLVRRITAGKGCKGKIESFTVTREGAIEQGL